MAWEAPSSTDVLRASAPALHHGIEARARPLPTFDAGGGCGPHGDLEQDGARPCQNGAAGWEREANPAFVLVAPRAMGSAPAQDGMAGGL